MPMFGWPSGPKPDHGNGQSSGDNSGQSNEWPRPYVERYAERYTDHYNQHTYQASQPVSLPAQLLNLGFTMLEIRRLVYLKARVVGQASEADEAERRRMLFYRRLYVDGRLNEGW